MAEEIDWDPGPVPALEARWGPVEDKALLHPPSAGVANTLIHRRCKESEKRFKLNVINFRKKTHKYI